VAKKLKTPRRKSVTKPVRRYDTSGRTIGSGATTRRTPKPPKPTGVTSLKPKRKVGRPSQGKTELVTAKSGNVYRRPVRAATPSASSRKVSPRNVYTKGRSAAIAGTGTQRVTSARGAGHGDKRSTARKSGMGYSQSAYAKMPSYKKATTLSGGITTGGPVKQSTKAEIRAMQKQMDAERNMNRAHAERSAFDERFRALKRKLSGIQGNPGLRGIFMGGGGGSKR
jgi:hypothetical protein